MENLPKPIILREGEYTRSDLGDFKRKEEIAVIKDVFDEQLRELFEIIYPAQRFAADHEEKVNIFISSRKTSRLTGDWILFPWNKTLLHTVNEKEYNLIRTNRNRNIITLEEQKKLLAFTVGVVGLSIGNVMAVTMAYAGISNTMKITDLDTLETTNLNRIRSGLQYLGEPKTNITCQQIYEINPYAELVIYPNGLNQNTLKDYVFGNPVPGLIFEAIDDFEMKVRVRLAAREAGIPLVMLTNLGDSLLIDVERYDLDSNLALFNGLVGNAADEILSGSISEADKQKYAIQLVGRDNIPDRVFESVGQVGKTLTGRPQLMSTVTIGGGVAAFLARAIALGHPLPSGRRSVKLDDVFLGSLFQRN